MGVKIMVNKIETFPVAEGFRNTDQVVTTPILNITFTIEQATDIKDILAHETKRNSNGSYALFDILKEFVEKWENKNSREVHIGDATDDFSE